jgi:hypothetical protein
VSGRASYPEEDVPESQTRRQAGLRAGGTGLLHTRPLGDLSPNAFFSLSGKLWVKKIKDENDSLTHITDPVAAATMLPPHLMLEAVVEDE